MHHWVQAHRHILTRASLSQHSLQAAVQQPQDRRRRRRPVGDVCALGAPVHPLWPDLGAQAAWEREDFARHADVERGVVDVDELLDARVAQTGGVGQRHHAEG
eukprot:6956985-Prymnesium_polylepis.1